MNHHSDTDPAPSDSDLAAAAADLQAALGDLSLDDPALWMQPSSELEERVMAGIDQTTATVVDLGEHRRRRLFWLLASTAAVVIALIAVVALRPADPDWIVALGATESAVGVEATASGWNRSANCEQ